MISQANMVQNIIDAYNLATPTILEDGFVWYGEGLLLITDIARNYGYSVEAVTAAMAHLSPRCMWSRNVLACERLCALQDKLPGIMTRSWDMAANALDADNPLETLNGDKVKRFAANFLGDTNSVTIDAWAVKVAAGDRWAEINLKHKGVYAKIEKAYQKAASILGIEPAHLQAITWIVIRNGRSS